MATVTGTLPEQLHPWVTRGVFKHLKMDELMYPDCFKVEDIGTAYADSWQVSGLGTFQSKPEGSPISYDDPVASDRKRVVMLTFALGFRATMEMIEDDQFNIVSRMSDDLGESARDHQENLAWGLFNDAFAGSTYTGLPEGDGTRRALCSTGHVRLKASGTASNSLSPGASFSQASLQSAVTNLELTQNEEGRYSKISPSKVVHHPNERWNVETVLGSTQEPATGNNAINPTSRLGLMGASVPYLTDTDAWFLLAEKNKHSLTFYMRKRVTTDVGKDSQSKDTLADAHYRAQVTFDTWQGVVGSAP